MFLPGPLTADCRADGKLQPATPLDFPPDLMQPFTRAHSEGLKAVRDRLKAADNPHHVCFMPPAGHLAVHAYMTPNIGVQCHVSAQPKPLAGQGILRGFKVGMLSRLTIMQCKKYFFRDCTADAEQLRISIQHGLSLQVCISSGVIGRSSASAEKPLRVLPLTLAASCVICRKWE